MCGPCRKLPSSLPKAAAQLLICTHEPTNQVRGVSEAWWAELWDQARTQVMRGGLCSVLSRQVFF